jgi:hypothetical protein
VSRTIQRNPSLLREAAARAAGVGVDRQTYPCIHALEPGTAAQHADDLLRQAEESKPLTKKNQVKLSIMGFSTRVRKDGTRVRKATPLPLYVATEPKARPPIPCKVCGAPEKATKAAGCDYLEAP